MKKCVTHTAEPSDFIVFFFTLWLHCALQVSSSCTCATSNLTFNTHKVLHAESIGIKIKTWEEIKKFYKQYKKYNYRVFSQKNNTKNKTINWAKKSCKSDQWNFIKTVVWCQLIDVDSNLKFFKYICWVVIFMIWTFYIIYIRVCICLGI